MRLEASRYMLYDHSISVTTLSARREVILLAKSFTESQRGDIRRVPDFKNELDWRLQLR
jgi:hypothetical protein